MWKKLGHLSAKIISDEWLQGSLPIKPSIIFADPDFLSSPGTVKLREGSLTAPGPTHRNLNLRTSRLPPCSKPIWSGKSSLKLIRDRLITPGSRAAPATPEAPETDTNLQTNNKTVSDLIWWEVINVKEWQSLD